MADAGDQELDLAQLLGSLGEELREANEQARANDVATLAWSEATIEVVLEVQTTVKGGIKFAVLGIGAQGGADRGTGRTIRGPGALCASGPTTHRGQRLPLATIGYRNKPTVVGDTDENNQA